MTNLHSPSRNPHPSREPHASRRALGIVCSIYFLGSAGLLHYLHGERGLTLSLAIAAIVTGVVVIAVFAVLLCQLSAAVDRIRTLEASSGQQRRAADR